MVFCAVAAVACIFGYVLLARTAVMGMTSLFYGNGYESIGRLVVVAFSVLGVLTGIFMALLGLSVAEAAPR